MEHNILFVAAFLLFWVSIYSFYRSRIFTLVPFVALFIMVTQYTYLDVESLISICYCSDTTIPVGEPIRNLTLPERASIGCQGAGIILGGISSGASVKGRTKVAVSTGVGAAICVGTGNLLDSLFGNFSKPVLSDGGPVSKK